ncbi:IclR family transcriptional regulator [Yinghuangia sp. YIM S10712]|uniref:IclR family transcriptional regulator n=1 Tax=Yinghuangia sp. YIM S10712 TaxID=3436930 RepID=UPI003F52C7FA
MDDHTVTGRVVAVLDVVAAGRGPVTLAELTRATGIPKPTVRRIAADLVARNMLRRDENGYRLGGRMLQYGMRASEQQGLSALSTPHVHDMLARTREIAWVGAVTDSGVTVLSLAFGTNRAEIAGSFGSGFSFGHPAFPATAMGRLILAEHPELLDRLRRRPPARLTRYTTTSWRRFDTVIAAIRDTGIATEVEQGALGYSCAAAPLRGPDGTLIGMIGVTGRTPRLSIGRLTGVLRSVAEDITTGLAAGSLSPGVAGHGGPASPVLGSEHVIVGD